MKYQMMSILTHPNYVISGKRLVQDKFLKIFSKMTFAHLSQATAESRRIFHRTQNTFNRIQNSLMTIEIHDQGKFISQRQRLKL